jgi:catechol 2,3-dioxygenase-like lactoylglutathione lyase family enzyme
MMYVTDVPRALEFYAKALGLLVVESQPYYARLRSPRGGATIALHHAASRRQVRADGVRLYFEARNLDEVCRRLEAQGVAIDQPPKNMPWGWRHAYLRDPDGHEISLYWAGRKRFQPTA